MNKYNYKIQPAYAHHYTKDNEEEYSEFESYSMLNNLEGDSVFHIKKLGEDNFKLYGGNEYFNITMNKEGVKQFINELQTFTEDKLIPLSVQYKIKVYDRHNY